MRLSEDLSVPSKWESRADRVTYLLGQYRLHVLFIGLSVALLVGSGRWSLPTLPQWATLWLKTAALGIIPLSVIGKRAVVDKYVSDSRLDVAVVDSETLTITGTKCPKGLWKDRERGDIPCYSPERLGLFDHYVTEFDYDEEEESLSVEGCPEEISNPLSVLGRNAKLKEVYRDSLEHRSRLKELEATLEARQLEADSQNVMDLLEAVEHGARFGGSALSTITAREDLSEPDADDREAVGEDPAPVESDRVTLRELAGTAKQGEARAATDGGQTDE